jgi:hypothetical protein
MPSQRQTVQPNEEVVAISGHERFCKVRKPFPSHAGHLSPSRELAQIHIRKRDSGNLLRSQFGKPGVSGEFPEGSAQKRWLFSELYGKKRGSERDITEYREIPSAIFN